MDLLYEKLLAMVLIFGLILIPSIIPVRIPVKFATSKKGILILSVTACFGGGVFFGAYLLHMAPEVDYLLREVWMRDNDLTFPYPQFFIGCGFFMLLAVEQTMYMLGGAVGGAPGKKKKEEAPTTIKTDEPIIALSFEKRAQRESFRAVVYPTSIADGEAVEKDGHTKSPPAPSAADTISVIDMNGSDAVCSVDYITGSDVKKREHHENTADDSHSAEAPAKKTGAEQEAESHGVRKTLMMMGALSSDCIFEGLSLGLQETNAGVWNLVIAILSHEIVIAFLLSLELLRHYSRRSVCWLALFYAVTCPAGIIVGIATMAAMGQHQSFPLISGIMQALCCGVFIYVTFFEILSRQFTGSHMTLKASFILIGYMVMAALAAIPSHHVSDPDGPRANETMSE